MATQTQKAEMQPIAPPPPATIGAFLEAQLEQVRGIVPADIPDEDVKRALSRISSNVQAMAHKVPGLKEAMKTPEGKRSLVVAVGECARLNLVPNAGPMSPIYLIPRVRKSKNSAGVWTEATEVTAQLSVRGLTTLAERQGYILEYGFVYEGEVFEHEVTESGTHFRHVPKLNRPLMDPVTLAPLQGGYVFATPVNGGPRLLRVVSLETIKKRRACSDAWAKVAISVRDGKLPTPQQGDWKAANALKTPWVEWADSMVAKTVLAEALARHMIALEEPIRAAIERSDAHDYIVDAEEERPDALAAVRALTATSPLEELADAPEDTDSRQREAEPIQTQAVQTEPAKAQREETPEEAHARQENEAYLKAHPQPTLLLGAK